MLIRIMDSKDEDTTSAIREWLRDEIKKAPGARVDLGRFFFAMSAISIGFFVMLKKIDLLTGDMRLLDRISLLLMCLSVLVALLMIVPGFRLLGPKVDLAREYQRQVLRLLAHILALVRHLVPRDHVRHMVPAALNAHFTISKRILPAAPAKPIDDGAKIGKMGRLRGADRPPVDCRRVPGFTVDSQRRCR